MFSSMRLLVVGITVAIVPLVLAVAGCASTDMPPELGDCVGPPSACRPPTAAAGGAAGGGAGSPAGSGGGNNGGLDGGPNGFPDAFPPPQGGNVDSGSGGGFGQGDSGIPGLGGPDF